MKYILILPLLLLFTIAKCQSNNFLKRLLSDPGGVTIVYGTDPGSLQAANVIKSRINALPSYSSWNNMKTATAFDADVYTVTGQTHIIIVGTLKDNIALAPRDWLPTWYMDWDWYNSTYSPDHRLSNAQLGTVAIPTTGQYFGGYGDWPASSPNVGYIEVDKSWYFGEWMVRSRLETVGNATGKIPDKAKQGLPTVDFYGRFQIPHGVANVSTYPKDYPLRLSVAVTGTGSAGVIAAANAFANNEMMSGVVLASGETASAGPPMFTLTAPRYASVLPFSPPMSGNKYTYIGWLLPDAFEYDGIAGITGVKPDKMFRLKYMPSFGITNFWTTPHRRAGEFEIAAIKFANATDAKTAKTKLEALTKTTLHPLKNGEKNEEGQIKASYFSIAMNGSYLYVRALNDGEDILAAISSQNNW